ncbi:hypothetical protein PRIPAC_76514 [Pristionchus pacificus]|nr:hypothetical protein PRIPAC_76514 [Pristionchus pacificus]
MEDFHGMGRVLRITTDRQFEMRRNGRIFLDRYLREPKGFARGVIELLSKRLALPLHFTFPITNPIPAKANEKFTVVILTFKRLETLKLMVAIFQSIEEVLQKIIIVWNNVNAPLPEGKILSKIQLQYIRPKKNSLNNRFLPWHKISTHCVLSIDDDIAVDSENLMLGFRTWQSERDRIVSFAPRRREVDERGKPSYSIEKSERHEFGLTGYAFLHRNYLYEYFTSMPAAFRNYVDAHRNCEDIAMNYLVAHLSQRPIMTVAVGISLDLVKNLTGLSSRNNHQQVRTECVRFFEAAYGYNPMQSSFYQAAAHDVLTKKRF